MPETKRTARREACQAERVAEVFGWVSVAWLLLVWESWRLPGARWLGVHTPWWFWWFILSLLFLSLVALCTLGALERRGMVIPFWAIMAALLSFLVPTLVVGIFLEYRLSVSARVRYWTGAVSLPIILAQGVLMLLRRRRGQR